MESQIGESSGTVSFSALSENTAEVLACSTTCSPRLSSARTKWNWRRRRSAAPLRGATTTPTAFWSASLRHILYGRNNPYGWSIEYADVDHIQRQDLIEFYNRYYFPANIMLGGLRRFLRRGDEGEADQAVRGLDREAAACSEVSGGAEDAKCPECFWRPRPTSPRPSSRWATWAASSARQGLSRLWKWPPTFWAEAFPAACFNASGPSSVTLMASAQAGAPITIIPACFRSAAARSRCTPWTR